ncbi:MAG: PLP-dependent transferase [Candidatus Vidania fulgoroideorum]
MKEITKIIHRKNTKIKNVNSYIKPIHSFSTVYFKNYKKLRKYEKLNKITYGTHGNPNEIELKRVISITEKGKYCILNTSGIQSIFLCYLALLKHKDKLLIPDYLYKPNKNIINFFKSKLKIKIIKYKYNFKYKTFIKKIKNKNIKMAFLEFPGSITFEIQKIKDFTKFCKKKKIISVIDSSYFANIEFKPLKRKFDIDIQALTKFQSGNNDILMGSITTNNKKIYKKIKKTNLLFGNNINGNDCKLILRSITETKYRYIKSEKKAKKIMKYIKNNKNIKFIIYPKNNKKDKKILKNNKIKHCAGIFTIVFKKKIKFKHIKKIINKFKIFKLGYSWGGKTSLIMTYKKLLKKRKKYKKYKNLNILRIYIGMENTKDLKKDIKQALNKFN